MTTLSILPASLSRLFITIDAAGASHPALAAAWQHWRQARGSRLMPDLGSLSLDVRSSLYQPIFVFQRRPVGDWSLTYAGRSAYHALGAPALPCSLTALKDRRLAVRLRCLFAQIETTAEPLAAKFVTPRRSGEIFAAPLGRDGSKVDALFGALMV